MTSRYDVSGAEGEFEPGSDGRVLRNRVGIRSPEDMEALELHLLGELYGDVLTRRFLDREITVADLKYWHRMWLGNVYSWAGEERSVNLGKEGFQFAHLPTDLALPRHIARGSLGNRARMSQGQEAAQPIQR